MDIARRWFLTRVPVAALAIPRATDAQHAERVYRIGFLTPGPVPHFSDPMIEELRTHGWAVGRNLVLDTRYTEGDPQRAEALARELVKERVDLIVTNITATAMAARRATTVVPIVMLTSGFPVEGGLAKSLARPGGNVTGMTVYAGGGPLFGKLVELVRELVASLRELGVLWGYAPPSYKMEQVAPATDELLRAAKVFNVKLRFWQTGTEGHLKAALDAAATVPLDAMFVTGGVIHGLPEIRSRIAAFTLQRRLPTVSDGAGPFFLDAGVLAYSADPKELGARAAYFVDRIFRGANPGDLPIEQPARYRLTVNRKRANALGLTIPPSLLLRADRFIE